MNSAKKFKRGRRTGRVGRCRKDARGTVQIKCALVSSSEIGQNHTKGNIVRSVVLANAKVSEVIAAINQAIVSGE